MSEQLSLREQKAALRRQIRARYPGDDVRNAESAALCAHVLASEAYRRADCIAGYMPMRREADVTPVLREALQAGKRLLLPRVESDGVMTFREIGRLEQLVIGSYGLLEPAEDAPIVPVNEAGLLLTPIEGIDAAGRRLGKGGGYYDRMLPHYTGTAIAAVMSWQWADQVPCDALDAPLRLAVDHTGLYKLPRT